jgi:hypothetical protein
MNFSNINILSKGTTRKSTAGQTRESAFAFRYSHYTKVSKAGVSEIINQFVFTSTGIDTLGVAGPSTSAAAFHDAENGIVGIAILGATKGNFLAPSKRSPNGKKSKTVTVPSLVKALAAEGLLDENFEGAQYYNVTPIGSDENGSYFQIVASEVPAKAYVAGEEEVEEDANNAE